MLIDHIKDIESAAISGGIELKVHGPAAGIESPMDVLQIIELHNSGEEDAISAIRQIDNLPGMER